MKKMMTTDDEDDTVGGIDAMAEARDDQSSKFITIYDGVAS